MSLSFLAATDPQQVRLPDGTVFESWEQPMVFKRTFHVDQENPLASDKNKGTARRPWKTIGKAAGALEPGDRVVIHAGIYREWVKPERGGSGPDCMISYEAAPGEDVVIKGSIPWNPVWRPSEYLRLKDVKTWQAELTPDMFEGANVFCLQNFPVQADMKTWTPYPGCELRRGQIFLDGEPLIQVGEFSALGEAPGRFWVDDNGMTVHVRLPRDEEPGGQPFEITTREQVFAPATPYLNYIRVKGRRMFHGANPIPIPTPQRGLLSATRGHHWIIEDCEIGYANTLGMDLGGQWWAYGAGEMQGYHIVRRNYIHHCGVSAISAWHNMPNMRMLVEDNLVTDCCGLPVADHCESAGIKIHRTEHSLVRRNVILRTYDGPALWLDGEILNTRITQNLCADVRKPHWGSLFLEINKGPNLCDNNIVIGANGNGIYEHDAERMMVLQNLVANGSGDAIHFRFGDPQRVNPPFQNHHRAFGNILVNFAGAIMRPNETTHSDYNLICMADASKAFKERDVPPYPIEELGIEAWRARGQDVHSVLSTAIVTFDINKLTLSAKCPVPAIPSFNDFPNLLPETTTARELLTFDYFGRPRSSETFQTGPIPDLPLDGTPISVDPRVSRAVNARSVRAN